MGNQNSKESTWDNLKSTIREFKGVGEKLNAFGPDGKSIPDHLRNALSNVTATAEKLGTCGAWVSFAYVASHAFSATRILTGTDAMGHFKKLAVEINTSLKSLCTAAEVSTNLQHQQVFPKWVYDFVSNEILKAERETPRDHYKAARAWPRSRHSLARFIRLCRHVGMFLFRSGKSFDCKPMQGQRPVHYFIVYHPGTAWHAAFNEMLKTKPLRNFIGTTDNIDVLRASLPSIRRCIGPEATIHILLPSAHLYIVPEYVRVPQDIQPLRITGQRHHTGAPFVHVPLDLDGQDDSSVRDVGLLPIPNEIGAGTIVCAVAGGTTAGVAATVAGAFVCGFVVAVCAPAAIPAIGAAMAVGGLGSGASAGALTGIHITEWARWKGTRADVKKPVKA
jgi:hypothetical protein